MECNWRRIESYPKVMLAFRGNGAKRVTFDYNGTQIQNLLLCVKTPQKVLIK